MTPLRHRWIGALPVLLTASCVAIGPTIRVEPGPGRSAQAFNQDKAECGRSTDARLQPEANALNGAATTAGQVAANNARIQREYDAAYGECMAARGDEPEGDFRQPATASAIPSPPPTMPEVASGYLSGGWSFLALGYHRRNVASRDPLDALWRAEIASPPAGPGSALAIQSVAVDIGDRREALVSMALQGAPACDDGPNTGTSTRDYASCPGKLAIIRDGEVVSSRDVGPLCGEVINAGGTAAGALDYKDPKRWGTRARYDPVKRIIRLTTVQNGRVEHACSVSLPIAPRR